MSLSPRGKSFSADRIPLLIWYERLPGSLVSSSLKGLIHVSTKSAFGHAIVRKHSGHPWAVRPTV